MNGVLILDKPAGISSARALYAVKRCLPPKTKVGHAGTLDPFATGVLLVLIGKATKSCEQLMGQRKTYEATIKLGATTETDDCDSPEIVTSQANPGPSTGVCSREIVDRALSDFIGSIEQRPPNFSAIKIRGRRACDRIREGESIALKPRTVQIYSIDVIDYEWPFVKVSIDCGRGTYIRSIARDLGEKLGVGGYLTQLRRTRIGDYSIDDALTPAELSPQQIADVLRPV